MVKNSKKIIATALSALLIVTLLGGCGGSKNAQESNMGAIGSYPVKTNTTLTYWLLLNSTLATTETNIGNTPFGKELQKETGINIQFIHPSTSQATQQFNILLASGSLPDIIEWDWSSFPGGPQKAIDSNYIINLNDAISKYAPNLKKFLDSRPDINKMVKTDSNAYYVFPFIRGDDMLLTYSGPAVRKDWLDDLNMSVPETIDDWGNMLKAFKEKKGAAAPLSFLDFAGTTTFALSGAFGVKNDFYVENNVVKFGPVENGFKAYLQTLHSWYAQGLLDSNLTTIDGKMLDSKILSGKTGATITTGGTIGKWLTAKKSSDPKFSIAPVPYPVINKGDTPQLGQRDWYYAKSGSAAITTSCKNVELAARLLDYGYSDAGRKLYNYGIEGISYNMVNGYPTYTDEIMKNPNGLAIQNALARYARAGYTGPFIQEKPYIEQYYTFPQQKESPVIWGKTDAKNHLMPPITFNSDESAQLSDIMNEVNTYVSEMMAKYIMGVESVDNFDQFVAQIKKLGIDKAIAIEQAALNRYNKR